MNVSMIEKSIRGSMDTELMNNFCVSLHFFFVDCQEKSELHTVLSSSRSIQEKNPKGGLSRVSTKRADHND